MSIPTNETILETIDRRLVPDPQAKKARGEVFTPLNLVRELLYGLQKSQLEKGVRVVWGVDETGTVVEASPDDRVGGIPLELWRDHTTKWLDPANGIGNFPFVAFYMLDFQLKHHAADETIRAMSDNERRTHIVEKMLYMIEIDKGNVNTSHKVMDYLIPGARANVCCADTLKVKDDDLQRHFGVSKFHVVMGNPPFNTSRTTKGQTGILWDKFILAGLDRLTPTGALAFITPQVWRKPEHKLYPHMTRDYKTHYLRILGERETQREFHVGSRVDMYVILQNRPGDSMSAVVDETGKVSMIRIDTFPFLPNYMIDDIGAILTDAERGIQVMHDRTMYGHDKRNVSKTRDERFKFPVMNSMTQKGNVPIYADANKGHFGVPKVILSVGRNQYPYNDYKGEYGLSDSVFGIPITSKEEGDSIVDAVNSDAFKEIIKATKWATFGTEHRMFKYFRPDFYKEFLKKPEGAPRLTTPRKKSKSTEHGTRRKITVRIPKSDL
jgi:hypothetical protein